MNALPHAMARAELVSEALRCVRGQTPSADLLRTVGADPTPTEGNWCAYGLSWLLDHCGFKAPPPGSRARRGARALPRYLAECTARNGWIIAPKMATMEACREWAHDNRLPLSQHHTLLAPGDVIAWWADRERQDWRGHVALYVGPGVVDPSAHGLVGANERLPDGSVGWHYTEVSTRALVFRLSGGIYGIARPVFNAERA